MPFQDALTSPQLVKLRGSDSVAPAYQARTFISLNANTVLYAARIDQVVFTFPTVELTYDGGSGTLADVLVGATVLISHTNDQAAAFFRGRIRKEPTSDTLYINETGARFADDDYIWVLDDYDTHIKLARWGGEILLDWENSFSGLPPRISDIRPVYADEVDSGSGAYEIDLAPTVDPGQSGETISAYLWTVPSGITITDGTTTTKDITIEADPGEYWIHFKATDSAGNSLTRHVKIFAHDADNPPALLSFEDVSISCEIPIEVNQGASEGYSATFTGYDQLGSVLERTLACIWTKETYNGDAGSLFNNILFVGRLRNETNTTDYGNDNRDSSASITIEGPLAILASIDAPSIEMVDSEDPSDVVLNVADLTVWRNLWALMTLFSTFGEVWPVTFSDDDLTFAYGDLVTQGSDLLSSIADLSQSIDAIIQQAPDGRVEIVRRGVMLLAPDREDLPLIANFDTRDFTEQLSFEKDYRPSVSRVVADGGGYNGTTTSAYLAVAPAGAPDDAPNESTLPRQILTADQTLLLDHNELAGRAGNALAAAQPPNILRVKMTDGCRWLTPAVDQWYYWTLAAEETARGRAFDSNTRWWLQSIELSPNAQQGTMDVVGTFIQETQGNAGQIIPLPAVDTGEFGFSLGDFDAISELEPVTASTVAYDLTTSQQGWVTFFGVYSGGFEADCDTSSQYVDISKELDEVQTITEITITYDATYAGGATNANKVYLRSPDGTWQQVALFTTETGTDVVKTIPIPNIPAIGIRIKMYADGAGCTGDLLIKAIEYETLSAPIWTEEFDFTLSDGGWAAVLSSAVYSGGVGWVGQHYSAVGVEWHGAGVSKSFTATNITRIQFFYTVGSYGPAGPAPDGRYGVIREGTFPTSTDLETEQSSTTGSLLLDWQGSRTMSLISVGKDVGWGIGGSGDPGGSVTITKVIVSGTRTNPFA